MQFTKILDQTDAVSAAKRKTGDDQFRLMLFEQLPRRGRRIGLRADLVPSALREEDRQTEARDRRAMDNKNARSVSSLCRGRSPRRFLCVLAPRKASAIPGRSVSRARPQVSIR